MAYTKKTKRKLYPTCLCYHGCSPNRADALTFREFNGDIKAHIRSLVDAGYNLLLPSEYKTWQQGGGPAYDGPVAVLHFDDCLGSIDQIIPWLIKNTIPCGIAIITRRLGKVDPENGFASWKQVREWVDTGLVEVMSHTHNLHHLTLLKNSGGEIDVGPVLEGPCWIDDGDAVYIRPGDTRWYWDFTHVDAITLGVPLWGTDPYDETTPVTTTLTITPKETGTVTLFRLWMALSKPSGAGYDAHVQIRAGGVLVWDGTIKPKVYETRSQWVEREFHTIELDSSFGIVSGVPVSLEFKTLNAGAGVSLLYGLATRDDAAFRAVTNCKGLYLAGSQGPPNRYWQYTDYPAGDRWPIVPCIILGFGGGRVATMPEYQAYVNSDCAMASSSVSKYLNAEWVERPLFDAADNARNYVPVGWASPSYVDAVIPIGGSGVAEFLRIAVGPAELFNGGAGWWNDSTFEPSPTDSTNMGRALDRSYPATFDLSVTELISETLASTVPYTPSPPQGSDVMGITGIFIDGIRATLRLGPYYDDDDVFIPPAAGEIYLLYGTTPTFYNIIFSEDDSGKPLSVAYRYFMEWSGVGQAAIWRIAKGLASDVTPFTLTPNTYLKIAPINGGPTIGDEAVTRWGVKKIVAGIRSTPSPAPAPDQIIYPFGSYNGAEGLAVVQQRPGFKDISPQLKSVFTNNGLSHGYTIQSLRNVIDGEVREPDMRQTEWALGRWLVYGDQELSVSINNLQAYSGYLLPDVQHRGVDWQVSLEADVLGNTTVRSRTDVLDFVAFDAWSFNGLASIGSAALVPNKCNDGGTYDGITYPNDRAFLQARGVKCLLILNNNLGTGEPDEAIAVDVLANPNIWIPLIVAKAQADGWDGITCNIEAAPASSRAAATAFYKAFGRAMHAVGLLAHMTAPAPTGTDYDADWWVGWCDHGEVVKYVDGIKIMSYTESGPGSEPGPAAPTWFWEAVYNRIRAIVPTLYWPRVLCGARAFGHIWERSDLEGASYVTYHQGISDALIYGARLDIRDTEMGWGNSTYASWFGTPLTVDRSQKEASDSGFGGLGLWKLDDGDIEEFFPPHKQIGRYEDMSYLDARFPPTISFGSSGGPTFNTITNRAQSGEEARRSLWTMPLYEFDASLRIRTQSEYEEVRDLFMVARGTARSFRYKDWMDFKMVGTVIGLGDGATVNFQCVKGYAAGGEVLVRKITKLVPGTVTVYSNGSATGAVTVSNNTGIISFSNPPAAGVEISVTCEFDVHVRFGLDRFPTEIISWGEEAYLTPGTVPLREVRK